MVSLSPFLLFDGNCEKAMQFYQSLLRWRSFPDAARRHSMKAQFPPEQHHKITYALLQSGNVEFSATDWLHPTHQRQLGNTTAMYVIGLILDELSPIFDKLREGADQEFLVELREMPFGIYGRLTDRYGVEWYFRGGQGSESMRL